MEHKLHVRRIVLDKVLIGILIIIVGAVANYTLEKYKSKETERRYRLTEQYKAALTVYEKAGALHTHYSQYCDDQKGHSEFIASHKVHLDKFANAVNSVDFLFSHKFTDVNQLFLHVHLGLVDDRIPVSGKKEFHDLAILLFERYKEELSEEIGIDRQKKYNDLRVLKMSSTDNPAAFVLKLKKQWISSPP